MSISDATSKANSAKTVFAVGATTFATTAFRVRLARTSRIWIGWTRVFAYLLPALPRTARNGESVNACAVAAKSGNYFWKRDAIMIGFGGTLFPLQATFYAAAKVVCIRTISKHGLRSGRESTRSPSRGFIPARKFVGYSTCEKKYSFPTTLTFLNNKVTYLENNLLRRFVEIVCRLKMMKES
jgi:hypothetical protein